MHDISIFSFVTELYWLCSTFIFGGPIVVNKGTLINNSTFMLAVVQCIVELISHPVCYCPLYASHLQLKRIHLNNYYLEPESGKLESHSLVTCIFNSMILKTKGSKWLTYLSNTKNRDLCGRICFAEFIPCHASIVPLIFTQSCQ